MDFGSLPPEINSTLMYTGPGSGSMHAAATAWNALAAEMRSAASSYGTVISQLTDESWTGPSSTAMAAAAAPYVAWMNTTAGEAEQTATAARAAAAAYQAAFAMTVPPSAVVANRTQLASLTATNILGQNTSAIAMTEAQYAEMWAQDAAAMYGYAANSAAAKVTPFTAAPQTTNQAGLAAQTVASTQAAGTSTGTGVQSTLSQLLSSIQGTLQSLASPGSTTSSGSGLSGILSQLLGGSSPLSGATTTGPGLTSGSSSGFSWGGTAQGLVDEYAVLPAWFAMMMTTSAVSPLMGSSQIGIQMAAQMAMQSAAQSAGAAAGLPGAAAAAAGGAAAGGFGGLAGLGGSAALGQAASVGALAVPQSWGWAATAPAALLGAAPLGVPAAGALPAAADLGAGLGFPFMFGGLPRAAAMGAGVGAGAAAVKYGLPLQKVMARPPSGGYPAEDEPVAAPAAKYPVPATFPTNGHAPPGYQPAIVYLPVNGKEAKV